MKQKNEYNTKANETKSWFFENINNTDKFLAKQIKKKKTANPN